MLSWIYWYYCLDLLPITGIYMLTAYQRYASRYTVPLPLFVEWKVHGTIAFLLSIILYPIS